MQTITQLLNNFDFKKFITEQKEPLVFAAITGLALATGRENLTLLQMRDWTANGCASSCVSQIFCLAIGHKGIVHPQAAPHLTNILSVITFAVWLYNPSSSFTTGLAVGNAAFRITTALFQSQHKTQWDYS